jgi:hypothetical protein
LPVEPVAHAEGGGKLVHPVVLGGGGPGGGEFLPARPEAAGGVGGVERGVGREGVGGAAGEIVEEEGGEAVERADEADYGGRGDLPDLGTKGGFGDLPGEAVKGKQLGRAEGRALGVEAALDEEIERGVVKQAADPGDELVGEAGGGVGPGEVFRDAAQLGSEGGVSGGAAGRRGAEKPITPRRARLSLELDVG